MWKLAIEDDEGQQTSLALVQGKYAIGRAETCTPRLTERNISRAHCTLRDAGDAWQLHDEGSYNGTYVNGQRVVESRQIGVGDIVQVGDYRLELLNEATIQPQSAELGNAASTRQRRPSRLVMVIGPTPGQEFPLDGERKTIGGAEECDILVDDVSVSRLHCELLSIGGERWEVLDKDGSDAMRVNGIALRRGIIEPGDALELGDVRLKFVGAGRFLHSATSPAIASGAIPFSHSVMPGAATSTMMPERRDIRRWLTSGAIIGLVVVLGFLLIPTKQGDSSLAEQSVVESQSEARGVLKDALNYAKDDLELAHRLLKRIPEDSPVRNEDDYREIEDRWAQAMIAQALDSEDKDEAMRLLNEVASADTVSLERRYQAIDILKDKGATDLPSLPAARPRKGRKTRGQASPALEDIYEDSEAGPKKRSPRKEDVYEDLDPMPRPLPRDDVYDGLDSPRPPRQRPPPAADSDPYE